MEMAVAARLSNEKRQVFQLKKIRNCRKLLKPFREANWPRRTK